LWFANQLAAYVQFAHGNLDAAVHQLEQLVVDRSRMSQKLFVDVLHTTLEVYEAQEDWAGAVGIMRTLRNTMSAPDDDLLLHHLDLCDKADDRDEFARLLQQIRGGVPTKNNKKRARFPSESPTPAPEVEKPMQKRRRLPES